MLKLTREHIVEHLFNGGFRGFSTEDYYAYADADKDALLANIYIGRYEYEVIFSPSTGDCEIYEIAEDTSACWNMDMATGKVEVLN